MKKISCLAVIIITAFFISKLSLDNNKNKQEQNELRGIFISYLEYLEYFQNKEPKEIKQKIDNIIENLIKYKINNIYLQVRPFSDSIYKSEIFPFSHTISGTQGKEINIDILKIFIDKAHKKEIHEEIRTHALDLLAHVGLSDKVDLYPHQLSGGQQQRVAIARALALQPDVLCFDEPTSALDPELTGEVLKVIKGLADKNTTMIIVTHEMAFARDVADRVLFMDGGVVVEEGPPEEVLGNPQQERTKQFLERYSNN